MPRPRVSSDLGCMAIEIIRSILSIEPAIIYKPTCTRTRQLKTATRWYQSTHPAAPAMQLFAKQPMHSAERCTKAASVPTGLGAAHPLGVTRTSLGVHAAYG